MFAIFAACGIILSMSFGQAVIIQRRIEELIAVSVMEVMILVYISGFLGNLQIGVWLSIFAAFMLLCVGIYQCVLHKELIKKFSSFYVMLFLIVILCAYYFNYGRMINEWDAFSHWGTTVKIMFQTDKFSNELGTSLHLPDYPPGTSLLQYFIQKFSSQYEEALLSVSQCLFIFSLMFSFFSKYKKQLSDYKKAVLVLAVLYVIPLGFYENAYFSLLVDAELGVIFAYILWIHYSEVYNAKTIPTNFTYYKEALAYAVLCIIKSSGIGLSFLAFICILADIYFMHEKLNDTREILFILAKSSTAFLIGVFTKFAWNQRLKFLGHSAHFNTREISVSSFIKIIGGEDRHIRSKRFQILSEDFLE